MAHILKNLMLHFSNLASNALSKFFRKPNVIYKTLILSIAALLITNAKNGY